MIKRAFVFPGQGSQSVGMGKEFYEAFPEARYVFEEVDEALNQKLSTLIFQGEPAELALTVNTQPALMAVSLAILRTLLQEGGRSLSDFCTFVAGHSLGEYAALTASQVFSLKDTAQLLRLRGESMQKAVPEGQGGMAALLGCDLAQAEALAQESAAQDPLKQSICVIANDNCPGQVVLSGHLQAIQKAQELGSSFGAKKVVPLAVSAPFHCSLMQPAAEAMERALKSIELNPPVLNVVSNVTAMPVQDFSAIPGLLVSQVTGRVRWRESIENMIALGVTEIVEIGAGKVLTGLAKRINSDIKATSLNTPQEMEDWLKSCV